MSLVSCLQVEYREPLSGVGRMPGGRSKSEGGPNDREAETAMLIEKAIMPLFPAGFNHNLTVSAPYLSVQQYAHVLSSSCIVLERVSAHCLLSIQAFVVMFSVYDMLTTSCVCIQYHRQW